MNIRNIERDCQTPRESVKIAQVNLTLASHFQLPFETSCELAHSHGHKDKQDEIDNFLGVLDAETVKRLVKEEGGCKHTTDCCDDRGNDPPARGSDHHW